MKSHTNEHTVRGRPKLKDVECFRIGVLCAQGVREIDLRANILSDFIKNHVITKEILTGAITSSIL